MIENKGSIEDVVIMSREEAEDLGAMESPDSFEDAREAQYEDVDEYDK